MTKRLTDKWTTLTLTENISFYQNDFQVTSDINVYATFFYDFSKYGHKSRQDRDKTETKLGQDRDKIGTRH